MEGLLPSMKSLRGGATAIDRVLDIATGWALSEAQRQLNGGPPVTPVLATDFEIQGIQGTEKEFKGKQHHRHPPQIFPGFLGLFWENIHLNEAATTLEDLGSRSCQDEQGPGQAGGPLKTMRKTSEFW